MDFVSVKEMEYGSVEWILLAKNRVKSQALANTVLKLRIQ